jgi:hypothetical protein
MLRSKILFGLAFSVVVVVVDAIVVVVVILLQNEVNPNTSIHCRRNVKKIEVFF